MIAMIQKASSQWGHLKAPSAEDAARAHPIWLKPEFAQQGEATNMNPIRNGSLALPRLHSGYPKTMPKWFATVNIVSSKFGAPIHPRFSGGWENPVFLGSNMVQQFWPTNQTNQKSNGFCWSCRSFASSTIGHGETPLVSEPWSF